MRGFTFKGGVHPYDGKEISMNAPIEDLLPGNELAFLLSQHIGAPAKAVVKKGDTVLKGQMIAESGGFVSAPIYSSVSGTVKGIEKRRNALGDQVDAIIITNDGEYQEVSYSPIGSLDELSKEEIIKRVQNAGVVGMGGAGFPTHVKLSPKDPNAIDHILVNGCECEPYLTSDYRCLLEQPDRILEGLLAMLKLFDNAKGVVCIEDNKPEAIKVMEEKVNALGNPRISVAVVQTKYPQGAERCLINAITKRELNAKMLPADVGCIVDNVDTLIAIRDAVYLGKPLTSRIFTLTGDAVKNPRNYHVQIGMSYQEIIDEAGGFKEEPEKIISGGPMMGFALFSTDVPVTKTSGAITCFTKDMVSRSKSTACIHCGRCLNGCPERLMPFKLSDLAEHNERDEFLKLNGLECVECGSCSFQCPAKRPLVQNIKAMKRTIMADMRKKK